MATSCQRGRRSVQAEIRGAPLQLYAEGLRVVLWKVPLLASQLLREVALNRHAARAVALLQIGDAVRHHLRHAVTALLKPICASRHG